MLLALDTATATISVALHSGEAIVAEHTWHAANHHTIELAPQVAAMLANAHLTPAQLHGIAVAIGPGSYTGLRIGLGFAKGLALAQAKPLVGISTFDSLMWAYPPRPEPVWALVAAGRGRVSVLEYRWADGQWQALPTTARLRDWAALKAELCALSQYPVYLCGEIEVAGLQVLQALDDQVRLAPPAQNLRRAGWLAEAGWARLRATGGDDVQQLAPWYGQLPEGA